MESLTNSIVDALVSERGWGREAAEDYVANNHDDITSYWQGDDSEPTVSDIVQIIDSEPIIGTSKIPAPNKGSITAPPTPPKKEVTTVANDTDWAPLEIIDFKALSDVWEYARLGAKTAGESGLVIIQAIPDFHLFLKDSALDPRTADRKARRVTRRLKSAVNHMTAIKNDFQRIPADVMSAFEDEIAHARKKTRPKIDWSK